MRFKGKGKRPETMEVFDMCFIRLGEYDFRRKWLDKDVSDSLTVAVLCGVAGLGMLVGFCLGWLMRGSSSAQFEDTAPVAWNWNSSMALS